MSAGHDHGAAGANEKDLRIVLGLTASFMAAEVIGGIAFKSLALISDAAHMFTDAAALAIVLVAIRVGERTADHKRTFGLPLRNSPRSLQRRRALSRRRPEDMVIASNLRSIARHMPPMSATKRERRSRFTRPNEVYRRKVAQVT